MTEADELMEKILDGRPLLEVFPMDGSATECPRCGLEFKTMLHPFCTHKHCPPREYGKQSVTKDLPRRIRLDLMTPAEKAIYDAVGAVERAGAHPLLTDAVILLQQAREKVADYVDGPAAAQSSPPQ